jgi:hypothetical protein
MFDGPFNHPLDNLIGDNKLFLMEAILPYLDHNMKVPLAMYIKISELRTIMSALRDKDFVKSKGLHKDIHNQEDILSSLAACGLSGFSEKMNEIKSAMTLMNSMEAFKGAEGGMFSGSGADTSANSGTNSNIAPDIDSGSSPPVNSDIDSGASSYVNSASSSHVNSDIDSSARSYVNSASSSHVNSDVSSGADYSDIFSSLSGLFEDYDKGALHN